MAVLTSVSVDGVPRFSSLLGSRSLATLEIPAGARRLAVEFAAPSLAPVTPPLFSTRLAGTEGDVGPPSADRRVLVAGLAPGRYRFEVRAVRADGRSGPPAGFDLVVAVLLRRRPWALGLGAAAVGLLALAGHRVRAGRLLAVERVRTRIATDLHDDLGASLSRISLLAEVVRREAEGRPTAQRLAVDIGAAARRMGGALSDGIWSIDPRHDDLRSVADRVFTFSRTSSRSAALRPRLQLPPDLCEERVAPEARRHLLLALQEALNNACRVARRGAVGGGPLPARERPAGRDGGRRRERAPARGDASHGVGEGPSRDEVPRGSARRVPRRRLGARVGDDPPLRDPAPAERMNVLFRGPERRRILQPGRERDRMTPRAISVGIVEDDPGFREAVRLLFDGPAGFRCAGTWGSVEEALRLAPSARPDVLLLDINLPGRSGLRPRAT